MTSRKSRRTAIAAALAALTATLAAPANANAFATPRLKPAAPEPTFVSRADEQRLLSVASALKSKDFATARSLTALTSDPIAASLGEWMYFMAQDPSVDFNEADAFLDSNPDWPMRTRISTFVEKKIPSDAPAHEVLAFFDTRPPVSGEGKIQLARALFAVGDQRGGEQFIRDAWINNNFKLAEERRILSTYGDRLTKEDHAARVDRLLWARQVTNARRVFSKLSSKDRRMAEARAALLLQASSGKKLFEKLPQDLQLDSGVLHAAVRHFRRRNDEQYAVALAKMAPSDPALLRNGERWWDERQLLMRSALKKGRFADAYAMAAGHALADGGDFAEAEFYAGWIALRFLDAPERAQTHFLALASGVGSPISVSRAYYWLGRAAKAQDDNAAAKGYFATAARHYYSYYGQMAAEEIGGAVTAAKFSPAGEASAADRALFSSRATVAALRILTDLNLDYEFMVFAYHVDGQLERQGEYLEFAKLTQGEGAPHLTVRAGKVAVQKNAFAPEVAYPLVFVPDEATRFVSPEIILGLSRQESEFNPRAYSRAGARGMMQLIPTTAQITARKEGLLYSRSALLDDPIYNMTIGSAHLSHLIERYNGSLIMTLAAYNAGAGRVDRWINEYGDPRSSSVDPLDWVELIPFSETRNYVQRVMENVQVYRGQLNDKPIPGRLYGDLERGGPRDRAASTKGPSIVLANAAAPFGAQNLPPLPERTAERARQYALSNPVLQSNTQLLPPAQSAPIETKAGAASPIVFEVKPTQPLNDTTASDLMDEKLRQPDTTSARVTSTPVASPAATATAAPIAGQEPFVPETDISPNANGDDISRPAAPALEPRLNTESVALNEKEEKEIADKASSLSTLTARNSDITPTLASEVTAPDNFNSDNAYVESAPMDTCLSYRDFLARNAEENAEAADLNAGMLAELQGGGAGC